MRELQQPTERPRREDGGTLLSTLIELWPYIWPADRHDLKSRVVFATMLLFLAKFATMAVPFTFKWATDALAGHGTAPVAANNWLVWVFAAPVALTLAYGGVRVIMALLTQWRDGIFAKVAMNAVRRLARLTF
jgi:ABC-type multidrug transport system fused ATPase/permease subunit